MLSLQLLESNAARLRLRLRSSAVAAINCFFMQLVTSSGTLHGLVLEGREAAGAPGYTLESL